MALINCADCGHQVSSEATQCPSCGRPIAGAGGRATTRCPHCGAEGVGKVRGLQGGKEVALGALLVVLGFLPGIIYYIRTESIPYCSSCGRRVKSATP